ncbi:MAG: hypothetical protein JNM58_10900 [Xanthomonadaceae bacterium]|nr:hypothetical protein [Xanthomonadaceae bacterium]
MTRNLKTPLSQALLVAVIGAVAVVGCKKKEEAATTAPPAATEPAAAPAPAVVATASVSTVDIGSAVGADQKISTATSTFKPNETFHVSIGTATSDPAATVAGKVGVKLVYMNGTEEMVVNDESRDMNLTGAGSTNFQFAKPDGWPAGKYKVYVSMNGSVVQTKEIEVTK